MTPNHVKRKLRSGTASVGSWLNLGSPTSAESLAASLCATPAYVNRRLAEGWKLVGIANDLRFMTAAARTAREAIQA